MILRSASLRSLISILKLFTDRNEWAKSLSFSVRDLLLGADHAITLNYHYKRAKFACFHSAFLQCQPVSVVRSQAHYVPATYFVFFRNIHQSSIKDFTAF